MNIIRKIAYVLCLIAFSIGTNAQSMFKGANVQQLAGHPEDSLLILRASEYYSAAHKKELNKDDVYNRWRVEPHKYYPMMYEAWKYCIDNCPEQLNLYLDGIDLHRWMINQSTTPEDSAKYYEALMEVWDRRANNVDLINKTVTKKSLVSSYNSIRMNKVYDWISFGSDRPTDYDSLYVLLFEQFEPIVDDFIESINNGESNGSDLSADQLWTFFNSVYTKWKVENNKFATSSDPAYKEAADKYNHLVDSARTVRDAYISEADKAKAAFNRNKTNASLQAKAQEAINAREKAKADYNAFVAQQNEWFLPIKEEHDAKTGHTSLEISAILLDNFDKMKRIVDKINSELESDTIDNTYTAMIGRCQHWIDEYANGIAKRKTMVQLFMENMDSIDTHKDDYRWLDKLVVEYKYTIDFDSNDPDYQQVVAYRDAAYHKLVEEGSKVKSTTISVKTGSRINYYNKAYDAFNKARSREQYFVLCVYYCDKAIEAGQQVSDARDLKSKCMKGIPGWKFMSGHKTGEYITIEGMRLRIP